MGQYNTSNSYGDDNNAPARSLLLFKHNPKAAGQSVLKVLMEMKPKRISDEYIENQMNKHNNTFEEVITNLENVNGTFYYKYEFGEITTREHNHAFVISTIREPCSQYVSLWSFGSTKRGEMHYNLSELKDTPSHSWTKKAYGRDSPLFDSERDINAFRHVWLRDKDVLGVIAQRFADSYGVSKAIMNSNKSNDEEAHDKYIKLPQQVDCWVYVENFVETFYNCLKEFEEQGGYIDWDTPTSRELVKKMKEKRRLNSNGEKYVKSGLTNVQSHHHSKCSTYFDDASAQLVVNGPENYIYKAFGYEGCCSTSYKRPQNLLVGTPETSSSTMNHQMLRYNHAFDDVGEEWEIEHIYFSGSIYRQINVFVYSCLAFILAVFFSRRR